jgi:hypothetical protein
VWKALLQYTLDDDGDDNNNNSNNNRGFVSVIMF